VAWWFCHWRNFWLKVLQQRRHQKSIKALTCSWYMCHVVYRYPNMPTWTKPVIIHEHDKTSSISTFQIFFFPSLPTLRQGRGGHGNRSNPATYPNAYDRSNQTTSLDIPCTDAERETRISNRMFPGFNEKVKRAAAKTWVTRLLNSCNMSSSSLMVF
jgi:hypothetical protein